MMSVDQSLVGRTVLIVGASRGIGEEIARDCARLGAQVVACARSVDSLNALASDVERNGGEIYPQFVDVKDPESIRRCVEAANSRFGKIDALVYAAGIAAVGKFEDIATDVWRDLFEVNVVGAVEFSRATLPGMKKRGWGRIVFVASTAAKYGSLFQSPYNASKHALLGFTKCLALESASDGVTVNSVCPGFVDTDMVHSVMLPERARLLGMDESEVLSALTQRIPTQSVLTVGEVASLTSHLLSEDSKNITGQGLTIDGGMILI